MACVRGGCAGVVGRPCPAPALPGLASMRAGIDHFELAKSLDGRALVGARRRSPGRPRSGRSALVLTGSGAQGGRSGGKRRIVGEGAGVSHAWRQRIEPYGCTTTARGSRRLAPPGGVARPCTARRCHHGLVHIHGPRHRMVSCRTLARGKANVYVNGVLRATVNLRSTTDERQQIVWASVGRNRSVGR